MGGSNRIHRPHRGSLQFWPRKRAKRVLPRVRTWKTNFSSEPKLAGFIGYKVGMTHIILKEIDHLSPTKKLQDASYAATVIECPPLKPLSIRFYKRNGNGLKLVGEHFASKVDKEVKRKTVSISEKKDVPETYDDVRLVVYTQPKKTCSGKKTPDIMEIAISGNDAKQKFEFAKSLLDKDIKVSEVLQDGQLLDVHGVTKGKGFQGTVKRFGVKRRSHKSEKTVRGVGNLGSWTPKRVEFSVAQPGKMGFHLRTEYNKLCLIVSDKPEKINQAGGFLNYGKVKNEYIIIKGSVPGARKRVLVLTQPLRPNSKLQIKPEIVYVSTSSKQGI